MSEPLEQYQPTQVQRRRSAKWDYRFDFFHRNGTLDLWKANSDYQSAFKATPFRQRMWIGSNFFAFFFGMFYLLFLGLWKKAITVLGVGLAIAITLSLLNAPSSLDLGVNIAFGGYLSSRVNVYYFDLKARGRHTWGL